MNRVEPNRNVYVGHRYVPLLVGEWDNSIEYEGLSIVTHKGASYTSKKRTPHGIKIENEEYWIMTGNYNAQIEYYRDETQRVSDSLKEKIDRNELTEFQVNINGELQTFKDTTNETIQSFKDETDEKLNDKAEKSHLTVNVKDYGAMGDGITDDTDSINDAFSSNDRVYFPEGDYIFNGEISNNNVEIIGDGMNKSIITTSADLVFTYIRTCDIKDVRFVSDTSNKNTLIENLTDTITGRLKRVRFQDYEYHINLPSNANGLRIEECYFRHGSYGIVGNLPHASSVIKSTFWQQSRYAIDFSRGTGGEIEGNSFVGTQGRPSSMKLYSNSHTIMNNYFEYYPSEGVNVDSAIIVEYNNASDLPIFINNLINGKDILNSGIKYVNIGSVSRGREIISIKNDITRTLSPVNINHREFDNIVTIGENLYPNEVSFDKMKYLSNIDSFTPGNGITKIPISQGTQYDPLNRLNGNRVSPGKSGLYKVSIILNASHNEEGQTGFKVKIRDESTGEVQDFDYRNDLNGSLQTQKFTKIFNSNVNSSFSSSIERIHGQGYIYPSSLNGIFEVEEI